MPAPIGAEDLYRFRWIDHVRLSRDGERVAYQLRWADADSRQNRSRVVVRRLLDPEPVDPTAGPRRDHSPEWSPDGRRLAFISRVGAADQLFVLPVAAGGEPRQLSSIPDGAADPLWSPDGSRIAFIGSMAGDPEAVVDDPRPPESREQARRAPVARVARRLDYKHDGTGYVDGRHQHLFVVSADGANVTQLTGGAWDVTGFDWSPDSTKLVATGNDEPGADLKRELNLYLVDLEGNRQRLGGGFYLSAPAWSPRGDLIAFIAPNGLEAGLLERLWVVPLTGGGPRCLTAGFDQAVQDSVINDMRAGHGSRLSWSAEGDRVHFLASGPGVTGIYSADLEGNVRQEAGGQRRIFDFDVASGVVAFCASDVSNPGDLHMLTQGAEARLTDLNPWLRDRYVAQPEHHQFTAPDGWLIEGWLLKPDGFDAHRLHPLVMEVHGGPHGQYGWTFFHELQILAGMGYLVLFINPRGSDGYGEDFRREVVRDWGGKDYADLMSALDQLIERTGYVDSDRMGIGGGSYGGYMTNWVIGQTDRFSAAVSMRSISNLVSEYAQHDIVVWGTLELGPPPWPDLDELWRRSPIRYVQNIRTPLLLTAGEMDLRCAISQSEELFGAMRLLGKTVELVRFPEESHDLSRSGRPDRRVERLRRIAGWYERFLGTAATDRTLEAATQVLPVPVTADRELGTATVSIGTLSPAESEITPEPESESAPEPEPSPPAEGLPVFPDSAVEIEPSAPEPEPAASMPDPVAMAPDGESAAAGPQAAATEPAASATEPSVAIFEGPQAAAAAEPPPSSPAAVSDPVSQTAIAWPGGAVHGRPGNGTQPASPQTFEEATSIIPAWQPPGSSKATVSMQAVPPEAITAGTGSGARLTFESGPFAGRIVTLANQMVSVGRAPDNDVVVGDPATSGHHGRIEVRSGAFWLSDLGSTNGTSVNGEPVIEKQLSDGDLIAIGLNTIRFTLGT